MFGGLKDQEGLISNFKENFSLQQLLLERRKTEPKSPFKY